mmetsp:Transcript_22526/g.36391  ORF Transcript_22526/g.36391 Transcript_22526/m.36391 type:complete len:215 (+) Transcript_22526:1330-1974(+)
MVVTTDQIGMRRLDGRIFRIRGCHLAVTEERRRQDQILNPAFHESRLEVVADIGRISGGNDYHLYGTGPFVDLGGLGINFFQIADLSSTMGQQGVHPFRPSSTNGFTNQNLYSCRNLSSGTHGIDFFQLTLNVRNGRFLFRRPMLRSLCMFERGRRFPQHGGPSSSPNGIQSKEDSTTIGTMFQMTSSSSPRGPSKPFLPQATGSIGSCRTSHG